jgi:hypothetical protein
VKNMLCGKSCSWEKYREKAHQDRPLEKKFNMKTKLKLQIL